MNWRKIIIAAGIFATPVLAQSIQDLQRMQREFESSLKQINNIKATEEQMDGEIPALGVLKIEVDSLATDQKYFGYSFFSSRTRIDLWENLPVPADYSLGAGDEIIISLWGESQYRASHVVSRNGNIYIDKVGQVPMSGGTLGEAKKYLEAQFGQVYSTLKNPNPTTYLDLTIGNLKMINVSFVGEVTQPGIHALHPFSRVTTGLIQAGGLEISGTLRAIQVIREGKVVSEVDLYTFLLKGQGAQDIQLRDQDIVYVPVRKLNVTITGEVNRPAIYEAKPGEHVGDMLAYSGFMKPLADTNVELRRILPPEFRLSNDNVFNTAYFPMDKVDSHLIQNGDEIIIRAVLPSTREVYIYGQVKRPGTYAYEESMLLLDLMQMAGGINDESYWKSVFTERAELIRRDEGSDYAKTFPINLEALRAGDAAQNVVLENLDQIVVRSNPYYDPPKNVTVLGEVNVPGVYVIQSDDERLQDILDRVGGFTVRAFEDGIRMYRRGERVILRDYSIAVAHADSIFVPFHPGTVRVIGEVYTPGLIHYRKELKLNDYIESAGGITLEARPNSISVEYANGDVRIRKFLYSPKIKEGATINIHRDQENPPFDPTAFLTSLSSVVASLATVVIILSTR